MPRAPKPWWYEQKQAWYAQIKGVKTRIGKHPPNAAKPKKGRTGWNAPKSICDKLSRMLDGLPVDTRADSSYVSSALQRFLEWARENRSAKTFKGYQDFLASFYEMWPTLEVGELKAWHVQEWVTSKPGWNNTTQRNAITALKRALNWSAEMEYINSNPIANMRKPKANTRTTMISPEEFSQILKANTVPEFEDLITVCYDCGCRPQEAKRLEARHVAEDLELWVLPTEEAKGKKHARAIYITTQRSKDIIQRLCEKNPDGPVFRNSRGAPWTGEAVKCRFAAIEEVVGKRFRQYDLRHAWITEKLKAGVDSHVVAKLAGHSDTSMLDRVYSHVSHDRDFMIDQAKRGVAEEDSEQSEADGGDEPSSERDSD